MYIEKLKDMFLHTTIKKDASLIPIYYHQEFICYTNEQAITYKEYLASHQEYYLHQKKYAVEYDDQTFLESGTKVAGRMWITITVPDEKPKRLEVILIAEFKEEKIYRLWELTYPDWSNLPEFEKKK